MERKKRRNEVARLGETVAGSILAFDGGGGGKREGGIYPAAEIKELQGAKRNIQHSEKFSVD